MPDLRDLLNVGRAAASGYVGYQQAQVDQEAERRRRQQEDVDRAEQTRLRALEAMLADERLQEARTPRFNIEDGQVVPEGGFSSREDAESAAGAMRARDRRQRMSDNNREVLQAGRVAEATARGRAAGTPAETAGVGGVGPDISKLPVDAQAAITQMGPTIDSLARYEREASGYLGSGFLSEMAGAVGIPAGREQDAAIGRIKAVQSEVLLNMKELARLGVLSGPDVDIVTNMIGDPVSVGAAVRSPEYVTARLGQVRQFVLSRLRAYDRIYGTALEEQFGEQLGIPRDDGDAGGGRSRGPGPGAGGAPTGDNEQRRMWDAAATVLQQRGQRPESVLGPRP